MAAGCRGAGDTFGSLGGFRQEGEAAVLATVASTNGAIGYASYAAVRAQGLPVVELATSADPASASQPDATDVVAAVRFAEIGGSLTKLQDGIYGVTADGSATPYPLVGVHYLLGCQTYADPETAAAVRDFVTMAITQPVDPAATYVLPTGRLADQVADLADTIQ